MHVANGIHAASYSTQCQTSPCNIGDLALSSVSLIKTQRCANLTVFCCLWGFALVLDTRMDLMNVVLMQGGCVLARLHHE